MSTLLIITATYPLGGITEPVFIRPEVETLCREFDRVIFAPVIDGTESEPLPANATVTRALAGRLPLLKRLKGMFSLKVWRNVLADRHQLGSLRDLRGSLAHSIYSRHYRERLLELIAAFGIDPTDTLVYTFWFTAATYAVTSIEGLRCVSRAHGHDIYPVQGCFLSHTQRNRALQRMLQLFAASDAGADFMRKCYPDNAAKITTARIGSRPPLGLNPAEGEPGVVTLLCVARTEPVKRVPLLYSLLAAWAESRQDLTVRWIYVGSGSEMPALRAALAARCPSNLSVELPGELENEEVQRLLATRHVDAVMLTSLSEGGCPVALSEALSYGVPVIATEVGGVGEIVTPPTGALLSPPRLRRNLSP
ncbi:MAG: glycosyltransferase [Duncaniella sp.]|nr:glycosyltransferase [Duncaniella sp.]